MTRSTRVVFPEFFQPTMPMRRGGLATSGLGSEQRACLFQIRRCIDVEEGIDGGAADFHGTEVGDRASLRICEAVQRKHILLELLGERIGKLNAP